MSVWLNQAYLRVCMCVCVYVKSLKAFLLFFLEKIKVIQSDIIEKVVIINFTVYLIPQLELYT